MRTSIRVAIEAAEAAGKLLQKEVRQNHHERIKNGQTAVDVITDSDIKSETLITQTILRNFSNHMILSEETSPSINPRQHKHVWIIDPLDGTIAFAAGLPFYSVSIAYTVDGELVSSALYMASTGDILWAETGKGAFIGRRRISTKDALWNNAVIALDPGYIYRTQALAEIAPALAEDIRFLQITSGEAGNLGFVAQGSLQGLICVFPDVWDYAAGMLLVQEAGGVMSDFQGKPYKLFSRASHIAASPKIHKRIVSFTEYFVANNLP